MNSKLNIDDDFFKTGLFQSIPNNIVKLNDEDEFESDDDFQDVTISDDEFNNLLDELGISTDSDTIDSESERQKFNKEMEFEYAKIQLERDILKSERAKFEKDKLEWEKSKKLSEENFQLEKDKWEKQKREEKEKIYLETKEIIDSCNDFKRFLENYSIIQDVSE